MKAILLAGGLGTRLREETEFRPKPMVEIGGRPILWHIMKSLGASGITDFIVATGYKSDMIKDYFLSYEARNNDFTIKLGSPNSLRFHDAHDEATWTVTVAFTGMDTMTGGRVLRASRYLDTNEPFLVTYGDCLADVDIRELTAFHNESGGLATVTTVRPVSRFGVLDVSDEGTVSRFREKPQLDAWVNAGYFIFEPGVVEYLSDSTALEDETIQTLAARGLLAAYRHHGFWQPMDTYRESQLLNGLWAKDAAPWKVW